ncbi:hypothetical protein JTB14_000377 [Gonioctena quinquepunctata]|nr:hypothetical protein JTB14_000377 [Gonioctena quinquepunctata]
MDIEMNNIKFDNQVSQGNGEKERMETTQTPPHPITISPESTQEKMETENTPSMKKFEDEYYQHLSEASEDVSCSIKMTDYEKTLEELENSKKQLDKDEVIKIASNKAEKNKNRDPEDFAMSSAEEETPEGQSKRKNNNHTNFKRRQRARTRKYSESNNVTRKGKEEPEISKKSELPQIAQQKPQEDEIPKSTSPPIILEDKVEKDKIPACLYPEIIELDGQTDRESQFSSSSEDENLADRSPKNKHKRRKTGKTPSEKDNDKNCHDGKKQQKPPPSPQ